MILVGHGLAAAFYLFAAVLGWRPARGIARGRGVPAVLAAGVATHAFGLFGMHLNQPPVPLESLPAALSLIGWGSAIAFLAAFPFARLEGIGAWTGLVAAGFTLCAELGFQLGGAAAPPSGGGLWSHAHVLLSTAGFAMLALSSLAGLGYLARERALKRKAGGPRGPELPPLESLDRVEHLSLSFGFGLLTLGVVTGFVWGLSRETSPWTGHAVFLLVAWGVYLVPVGLRLVRHEHGPVPAVGVVLGFAVLAFAYVGVRVWGAIA